MRVTTLAGIVACTFFVSGCLGFGRNTIEPNHLKLLSSHANSLTVTAIASQRVVKIFNPPSPGVTITNENPYSGIDVIVNGKDQYHISAAGQLQISKLVKVMSIQAQSSPCDVVIQKGTEPLARNMQRKSVMNYTALNAAVVAQSGSIYYKSAGTTLRRSTDNGKTWSASVAEVDADDYFSAGTITSTGKVVVFTNKGRVFQSDDGVHFHEVNMQKFNSPHVLSPFWHGIDSNGDTVVFGEYGTAANRDYRVFTSYDGGKSWQVTINVPNPTNIRHFHSVNYNPYNKSWYITSGDMDSQIHWWISSDAKTWSEIPGISDQVVGGGNGQVFRTLTLYFPDKNTVMWGSDAGHGSTKCGIYRAPISDPSKATLVTPLPHACYGLSGLGKLLIATCGIEQGDTDHNAYIYVSTNGGLTWHADMVWGMDPSKAPPAGFRSGLRGPDSLGRFYVQEIRLYAESGVNGLLLTPPK